MGKIIRGIICLCACGVCFITLNLHVYASINGDEQRVINVASSIFEFNGKKYQSTQAAMSQLVSYLDQDDIDLTAEQANEAITKMYNGIEQGISDGYLELVPGSEPQPPVEPEPIVNKDNEIVVPDSQEESKEPISEKSKTKVSEKPEESEEVKIDAGLVGVITRDNEVKKEEVVQEVKEEVTTVTSEIVVKEVVPDEPIEEPLLLLGFLSVPVAIGIAIGIVAIITGAVLLVMKKRKKVR